MKDGAKTEWIHLRVTKELKARILKYDVPVTQFVTEAIRVKLEKLEA